MNTRTLRNAARIAGSGLLFAWCFFAAGSALQRSLARAPDPMATLEAEFLPFVVELPATGEIGYLEPYSGSTEETVRMHYAAQYALTPRVVSARTGPEFLIVARGMARPDGDPRLDGYDLAASFPSGHRLFRRVPR
jgi:hypothetical protein